MLFNLLRGANFSFSTVIIYIISALTVVFLTMPVHEFAHAFAANKLGDPTARFSGRLTLNPMAHIDIIGAVCIILFGFGWAKPVPINTSYFKNPKRDMALSAVAGPLSNLLVALVALLISNIFYTINLNVDIGIFSYIFFFLYFVASINISLAVFNLIPIPPLDGSRILTAILPNRTYYKLMRYERYFFIALIALLWLGILDIPLTFLSTNIKNALQFIANLPFKYFW